MKIRIWPDGDSQLTDEPAYEWKSDDFIIRETALCENCNHVLIPEYNEPFASCLCGTQEWYK